MLRSVRALPEEVLFFARIGTYGLFIGTVYWFVSYEVAGTVLLLLFGVGASGLAIVLSRAAPERNPVRRADAGAPERGGEEGASAAPAPSVEDEAAAGDASRTPDGPFGDESGRIPGPSFAPLEVGFGIALATLGIVFGPWLVVAAALPLANGARTWLQGASREFEAVDSGQSGSDA